MGYSSNLTDAEWEILEPLLPEVLPQKKKTKPVTWSYRELIDGMLYRLKNGCNWEDLPTDFPPYSTVFWHYNEWRKAGSIETLMTLLHGQVREQVKKAQMDNTNHGRLASSEEHLQCERGVERVLFLQNHQWHQATSSS